MPVFIFSFDNPLGNSGWQFQWDQGLSGTAPDAGMADCLFTMDAIMGSQKWIARRYLIRKPNTVPARWHSMHGYVLIGPGYPQTWWSTICIKRRVTRSKRDHRPYLCCEPFCWAFYRKSLKLCKKRRIRNERLSENFISGSSTSISNNSLILFIR